MDQNGRRIFTLDGVWRAVIDPIEKIVGFGSLEKVSGSHA
jgi:hypothetical protein